MSEIITLSSSDEESARPEEPIKKRLKPLTLSSSKKKSEKVEVIILSESDEESINELGEVNNKRKEPNRNQINNNDIQKTNNKIKDINKVKIINEAEKTRHKIEEKAKSDDPEKKLDNGDSQENIPTSSQSSEELLTCIGAEVIDHEEQFQLFLKTCETSVTGTQFSRLKEKFYILEKLFAKYKSTNDLDEECKKILIKKTEQAKISSKDAVVAFNDVIEHLKSEVSASKLAVPAEHKAKVKRLLKTCKALIKKIRKLEETEVDWDDESNSAYIQEDRYKAKLVKVFNAYCKYVKMNPKAGRITYKKIDFTASNYDKINQAINKKYKDNSVFPSYVDIEKLVKGCVEDHDLNLSESKIKSESERCFKKLGELLQKRRKDELYESHYYFIRDIKDPASGDVSLEMNLKQNFKESMKKIEDICQQFVEKQNQGVEVTVSEDSDDSNLSESEDGD